MLLALSLPHLARQRILGPYLTNAQASGADAIFVFYAGGGAINFVKQYGSFDIQTPLYGSGFLTSPLYVAAEGDAAIGVRASLHYIPTLDTPENKAFVDAFMAKHGTMPSEYSVQGYDAALALMAAVDKGGSDSKSIAAALPQVSYIVLAAHLKSTLQQTISFRISMFTIR